jgi:D-alanyl-D-alanine carboxypeptidase (penicillin-binding protein 5/6)
VVLLLTAAVGPASAEQAADDGISVPAEDPFFLGPPLELDVGSFVLLEPNSGQILAQSNASEPTGPASLAKIMTLKLAFEALEEGTLSMDDQALVSEKAWSTGGSKLFILVDSRVTIHDLIYGIAISSGNDAAVALAEHMAGDESVFVRKMNERARELGMTDTTFRTAHGLPAEGQQTTALDMARLARAFMRDHPEAMDIMAQREFTYNGIRQFNRNGLLEDERVNGLKTGHTAQAGYHLVATAQKEGMSLVAVVLGAPGKDEKEGSKNRERAASKLLNYGFNGFRTRELDWTQAARSTVRVWKGQEDELTVGAAEPTVVTYRAGDEGSLSVKVQLPEAVDAPVAAGDELGQLVIAQGDDVLDEFQLVAQDSVGFFRVLLDSLRKFFSQLLAR